ncbi:MAG: DNA polymerase I [Chitinophagaceae bacterium]
MNKKLFLLDAFALIFRAYYALIRNPRITSKGKNTNAQFGFTNTLIDLLNKQKPTHMAVCFDTEEDTERHIEYAEYKANRQEAPEDLLASLPDIRKIIEGLNIPIIETHGYEADDVIGTLALQAERLGYDVFMVTPDKDYGQLVSEKIKIYKPPYQGGDFEIIGPDEVCAKWGIQQVSQVIDILGLMGDSVDNIPGIPGVGEKTAAKLLAEFGTLENVIANADQLKGSLGEKVRNGKDLAVMSKKLATIITNAPVQFHEENFCVKEMNKPALKEVFADLEFKTLGKRILGEEFNVFESNNIGVQQDLFGNVVETKNSSSSGIQKQKTDNTKTEEANAETNDPEAGSNINAEKNIHNTPHHYHVSASDQEVDQLISLMLQEKEISFDSETTGLDANIAELVGLSFSWKTGEGYYVPCSKDRKETEALLEKFKKLFDRTDVLWIGQNIKYDLLMLKNYGYELKGNIFDTMLAHYVMEPEGKRGMDLLSAQYLGYEPVHIEELIGKKGKSQGNMRDVELEKIKEYAVEDADITLQLKQIFIKGIKEKDVEKVFYEVENPLAQVLKDMEYEGVRIDESFLREYSVELDKEARAAEERVFAASGCKFNLSSPKQLGEVLFEQLKLDPKAKKTKTGQYATGEDILVKLSHLHPVPADVLVYRELTKLKSTYVDALPQLINPRTGRVHTTYGSAIAVTGRLASNNPNLQNIPIRSERGKEIRKAFIPRDKDHVLLSADYSQIELRIVAAISGDPNMCEAFRSNKDIHTATAAKVYDIDEAEVTKEQRYKAKSVNFGIIYGQGAFGLADNLGISRTEAKTIIDNYKKEFSGITKYMDDMIQFAREKGYVQTLMGRKRWLRDINSANFTVRGFAERNAINSPIQGTAADMIKLAMINVQSEMKKREFKSKMILQVHDELVFDIYKPELEEVRSLVLEKMQHALPLPNEVPVIAESGVGDNWLEAH